MVASPDGAATTTPNASSVRAIGWGSNTVVATSATGFSPGAASSAGTDFFPPYQPARAPATISRPRKTFFIGGSVDDRPIEQRTAGGNFEGDAEFENILTQ